MSHKVAKAQRKLARVNYDPALASFKTFNTAIQATMRRVRRESAHALKPKR